MKFFFGIFFILHALVHLLYFGQALRFFELRPGMTWPINSWLFSRLLSDPATRWLTAVLLILIALGFLAAGVGLFLETSWWRTITYGAVGLSILIYLLFWNGKFHNLPEQGGVGLLINLAILGVTLVFKLRP